MKYCGLIIILSSCLIVQGCKKKYIQDFKYERVNQNICVLKPQAIFNSDDFSRLDIVFLYANGNVNDVLTSKVYQSSLHNLENHQQKYMFCLNQLDFFKDYLETQIRIELIQDKMIKEYEFRNYSCVLLHHTQLNLSKNKAMKYCD
ncbi:hypothetical protein [Acinetobacter bereziniae]|uniref:hypothetical protein n=1 Tax=Acinetobacter bereziniae TaxID=106648 RepID=UPI001901C159|nr:hypothetical protein [Acinetobacter bereziniae]MBJ8445188.1 hypothetical protein [Acinetobacter bereziniae]